MAGADLPSQVKLLIIDSIARPFLNLSTLPDAAVSKQHAVYQLNHALQALSSLGMAVILAGAFV